MPLISKKPVTSIIKLEGRDVVNDTLCYECTWPPYKSSFILAACNLHDIVRTIYTLETQLNFHPFSVPPHAHTTISIRAGLNRFWGQINLKQQA